MIRYALGTILVIAVVGSVHLYRHLGLSKDATIHNVIEKEFLLLAKRHVGPYHKINEVIVETENWAKKNDIDCKTTFGLYLDDPLSADEDRLRSDGGCVLRKNISTAAIKNTKLKLLKLENRPYLKLSFTGSPAVGPYKAYPMGHEWIRNSLYELDGPILETYKIGGSDSVTTFYYMPLKAVK